VHGLYLFVLQNKVKVQNSAKQSEVMSHARFFSLPTLSCIHQVCLLRVTHRFDAIGSDDAHAQTKAAAQPPVFLRWSFMKAEDNSWHSILILWGGRNNVFFRKMYNRHVAICQRCPVENKYMKENEVYILAPTAFTIRSYL